MEKIGLFLAQLRRAPSEELLRLWEVMSSLPQEEEESLFSYAFLKSRLPSLSVGEENFVSARERAEKIEEEIEKAGISCLSFFDENYPAKLRRISQPPKVLYYKGDLSLIAYPRIIAVVGSRKPTPYGIWATKKLVGELAANDFCIVSGMAAGVDGVSHEEALRENGKTVCVLGGSIDKPYPRSNIPLMKRVLEAGGLILSEYSPLDPTLPANFALRNRIISALSEGVLITEAGMKSGTLITAGHALEQGKTVFAVPGNINSKYSLGTNALIKDGAVMTCCVYDILSEFRIEVCQSGPKEKTKGLSEIEKKIYENVRTRGICHVEQLTLLTGLAVGDVIGVLNIMEIKGLLNFDGLTVSMP
ncbi:MAG: DNA-processing protein DprA [Peptostreptococcaceae bacterium]|nr:DNA-processing protein DprA [Peptostreptococcaceae bacterium]